jgi:hypothetical protein
MRVAQRLFLAVIPAILGLFAVAALAYWGQYARQAPAVVIVVAIIAAVVSLAVAWQNARYLAHRIERLAGAARIHRRRLETGGPPETPPSRSIRKLSPPDARDSDELDAIERTVHGLSHVVSQARGDRTRREHDAEVRAANAEELLREAIRTIGAHVKQIQLPLHILLMSPFGELNENQEEILAAARAAGDAADVHLRQLGRLLEIERGDLPIVLKPTGLAELLRPALAMAEAHAAKARVPFHATVSSTAPRVIVDPRYAQDALSAIFTVAVDRTPSHETVTVDAGESENGRITIRIAHGRRTLPAPIELRLATRLIEAEGGTVEDALNSMTIELPGEPLREVSRG